jgi:hypothetical protein
MLKLPTVCGGKDPHPNDLVGGAPCSSSLEESNAILGRLPRVLLAAIAVGRLQPMQMTRSPKIEASLPEVVATVERLVATLV